MQDLIYLFARGGEYRHMAALLVKSLRKVGKFQGRIVTYLDGIDMHSIDFNNGELINAEWMKGSPWEIDRAVAMAHIKSEDYRTITLLDSDIIALGDITPILDRCADQQCILHQEETWQRYKDCGPGHHQEMYLQAMTPEQRTAVRDMHPINAGALSWPSILHERLMDQWLACIRTAPNGHAKDQATLNAVLRFGGLPVQVYDQHDVGNASQSKKETWRDYRLLHFAGFHSRLKFMTELSQ